MSKASKLVAIALIVVVVVAGVGYWLFSPKPTSEIVNYTSAETSLEVSRRTPEQTLTTSTSSPTTTAAETTLWINVTATKPVSYYLSLLKSTQTQPYVDLAWDLQALPDATNATAIAQITYLALNATNPEVKEAFQLMLKGGTPEPRDYSYSVPSYNTELQVLYWLACQDEFKKDDTLALAVAIVNGLWITMGDQQVGLAVKNDTSNLLTFFRDTDQIQNSKGFRSLERLPLEAKICLAWTGGYSTSGGRPYPLRRYENKRLPLRGYLWDTVSLQALKKMRDFMVTQGWIVADVDATTAHVEEYLYTGAKPHWIYTGNTETEYIEVDGEKVLVHDMNNVDFGFQYLLDHGHGMGDCGDESELVDALLKSWGIATTYVLHQSYNKDMTDIVWSHMKISYYEPASKSWKIYLGQLNIGINENYLFTLYIYRPPITLPNYLNYHPTPSFRFQQYGNMCYVFGKQLSAEEIKTMFLTGVQTSQMKQWLLYS